MLIKTKTMGLNRLIEELRLMGVSEILKVSEDNDYLHIEVC